MRSEFRHKAGQALALVLEPGFLSALTTWPIFSITSFLMMAQLRGAGLRPRTIIDVGANSGQFAVSAAKYFPDAIVHSYEPVPESYRRLKKAAAHLRNIRTSPLALSDTAGHLELTVNSHSHSSSVLRLTECHKKAFPFAREIKTIVVPAGTLDEEYRDRDIPAPALLKIDVQGFETRVLNGAHKTMPRLDHIVLEMSFEPLYQGERTFTEMIALMNGLGFDLMAPVGFLKHPHSGQYLQMDGLFSRRGVNERAF